MLQNGPAIVSVQEPSSKTESMEEAVMVELEFALLPVRQAIVSRSSSSLNTAFQSSVHLASSTSITLQYSISYQTQASSYSILKYILS